MKTVESAGIVVYHQTTADIEYLLLHYAAGHWDFAKGHLEPGETKKQAAVRELHEETGLRAALLPDFEDSFSYFFKDYATGERFKKTVYFFVGSVATKDVLLSDEHQDFVWLPFAKVLEKLTYQNAQILLKKADAYINKSKN